MELTQQECNTGHDDDESDEADSRSGAEDRSCLRLTVAEGVTETNSDIDLMVRAESRAPRVRHQYRDYILSHLQVYNGLQLCVSI